MGGAPVGKIHGHTALITGAGRGIGRALCVAFANEGCSIVAASRTAASLEETAELCRAAGVEVLPVVADVSSEADVAALFASANERFGQVDILVNNAGILKLAPLAETDVEDFDRLMAVNFRGTLLCIKAVLPQMMERKSGTIINIASNAGTKAIVNQSAYCASKHAVVGLSKTLSLEMRDYNVRVSAICPGGVATDMTLNDRPDWSPDDLMGPEDVAEMAVFVAKMSPRMAMDQVVLRRWPANP
jgi:3-oxoacyl-[acyl-carrier protein] reductase